MQAECKTYLHVLTAEQQFQYLCTAQGALPGDDVMILCTAPNAPLLRVGLRRPPREYGSIVPL